MTYSWTEGYTIMAGLHVKIMAKFASWSGLAVRRQAGKQKDLGSIPLRLSSIFKKLWFVDTAL